MAKIISSAEFKSEVIDKPGYTLVDFFAVWCGPCGALGPIVDSLAEDLAGTLQVVKVNIDNSPDLASAYGISAVPTLILFKDGKEDKRIVGLLQKEQLRAQLGL